MSILSYFLQNDGNNIVMNVKNIQLRTIGGRIRLARENLGYPRSKISDKMHLLKAMCGQWERGISNPSTAHLVKLASILSVSFEWLATGGDDTKGDDRNHSSVDDNTKILKINQLLDKTTSKQKDYLLELLNDLTR